MLPCPWLHAYLARAPRSAVAVAVLCLVWATPAPYVYAQANPAAFVRPEYLFTIGDDESGPSFAFGRISGVAVSVHGRVYVLDGLECSVRIFSDRGKPIGSFGRAGGGPGEFSCASALTVAGAQVRLLDHQQRRVAVFTLDGKHVGTNQLPLLGDEAPSLIVNRPLAHGWSLRSSTSVVTLGPLPSYDPFRHLILRHSGQRRVDTVAKLRLDVVLTSRGDDFGRAVPAGFGDRGAWALLGDLLRRWMAIRGSCAGLP